MILFVGLTCALFTVIHIVINKKLACVWEKCGKILVVKNGEMWENVSKVYTFMTVLKS